MEVSRTVSVRSVSNAIDGGLMAKHRLRVPELTGDSEYVCAGSTTSAGQNSIGDSHTGALWEA